MLPSEDQEKIIKDYVISIFSLKVGITECPQGAFSIPSLISEKSLTGPGKTFNSISQLNLLSLSFTSIVCFRYFDLEAQFGTGWSRFTGSTFYCVFFLFPHTGLFEVHFRVKSY